MAMLLEQFGFIHVQIGRMPTLQANAHNQHRCKWNESATKFISGWTLNIEKRRKRRHRTRSKHIRRSCLDSGLNAGLKDAQAERAPERAFD